MGVILAILIFSFIIFFHELGHFLLAKKNGIRVDEFSIGMGPRLLSKQAGETRYSWKLLPIGGSCMMGEDDVDDMSEGSFNSKSVWARISVIVAGPIFNFILAFIFAMILVIWVGVDRPVIGNVAEGYPAEAAGLQTGDKIISLNNTKIHIFREISSYNLYHAGEEVVVGYERDGEQYSVNIQPVQEEEGYYLLGLGSVGYTKASGLEVVKYGAYEVKYWISSTLQNLKGLVTGLFGIKDLSGPVGIVNIVDDTYQQSKSSGIGAVVMNLMYLAIILSANLGVMNLLPLPALDGGRLVFLTAEGVRGKRVPPEKEGFVHMIGLVLLLLLMAVVMYNDIRSIFV